MDNKVVAGGVTISGTYCVLSVDGALEWLVWGLIILVVVYILHAILDLKRFFVSEEEEEKEKKPKEQQQPAPQQPPPQNNHYQGY